MSRFDLVTDVPVIHNREELAQWLRPLYIIDDILVDDDTYNNMRNCILNLVRGSFTIRACREYPIKFKFNKKDKEEYQLELRDFLINLILFEPFIELYGLNVLDKSYIFDCKTGIPNIENYINNKIILTLKDYQVKNTYLNIRISNVIYNLRMISVDFSQILGLNFNIFTFADMYSSNTEIRDIMETKFDESLQPYEIEAQLKELQNREMQIYKDLPDNELGAILRSATGVKPKQFTEFTIAGGLKPTIDGYTIPEVIQNSILIGGLDRPSYFYIDAGGANKSLIMNKRVMGSAGYFGKLVSLLTRTLSMDTEISDCGNPHLIEIELKTNTHLKRCDGKYFKVNKNDIDYSVLNYEKHKHLVGKKIYIRSAITCGLGNHVCAKCIGIQALTNADIANGVSTFYSEEVTKVVEQNILSTKHLLETFSEIIKFNDNFYKFFTLIGGEIMPVLQVEDEDKDIDDYAIYINPDDINKVDEYEDDSLFNNFLPDAKFVIRNINNPKEEDIPIELEDKELFISKDVMKDIYKNNGYIYFSELNEDMKLFEINIQNKELTKPLYDLMDLINKKKDNDNETIDSMLQQFLDLMVTAKISASIVAGEVIINRLIKDVNDPYVRPDFSQEIMPKYQIKTVKNALTKNKSPLIGLSSENLKKQLLDDELYTTRYEESYVDPLFKETISMKRLKGYSKLVRK
nr:MAG TPA: DNA-directed RNA polymerase subunit alpha [Caudoviricetes sp.]